MTHQLNEVIGIDPSWLETHSWNRPDWTVEQLIAAKKGRTVSVVLPALNEQETVAAVVDTISPLLGSLVDELIVLLDRLRARQKTRQKTGKDER